MRSTLIIISYAFLLSGCASSITAWKNRPVADHTLRPDRFFSLTAERRLAFQVDKDNRKNIAWCAESLPEAAQGVSSSSKLTGKGKVLELGTDDAYSTTLTQTFARTEIAEIYRQMAFQACQAWAQRVYDDTHYRQKLDEILAVGIDAIRARASQPLPGTPIPAATPTVAAAAAGPAKVVVPPAAK